MTFFYVFFAAIALVHLYACYFYMDKLRLVTKPLLLASLAVFYILAAYPINAFVLAALLCGLIGDVFLMLPFNDRNFMLGAGTFGIGHALYAAAVYTRLFASGAAFSPWLVLLIALPYLAAIVIAGARLMPHIENRFIRANIPVYFALIAAHSVGAWLLLIHTSNAGGSVSGAAQMVLGGALFFISDAILVRGLFVKENEKMNFYVMLTYIAAQFLLCRGFLGAL